MADATKPSGGSPSITVVADRNECQRERRRSTKLRDRRRRRHRAMEWPSPLCLRHPIIHHRTGPAIRSRTMRATIPKRSDWRQLAGRSTNASGNAVAIDGFSLRFEGRLTREAVPAGSVRDVSPSCLRSRLSGRVEEPAERRRWPQVHSSARPPPARAEAIHRYCSAKDRSPF